MEEEEIFVGCICCMSTKDLINLFTTHAENEETYAQMFHTCFEVKVTNEFKYICEQCAEKLELATVLKNQTVQNISMLQNIRDEEYLDESILAEAEGVTEGTPPPRCNNGANAVEGVYPVEALDDTSCMYCGVQLSSAEQAERHMNRHLDKAGHS